MESMQIHCPHKNARVAFLDLHFQPLRLQDPCGRWAKRCKTCTFTQKSISRWMASKYSPLIRCVKPTVRTVKVWLDGADSALQQSFIKHWLNYVCHSGHPRLPLTLTLIYTPPLFWTVSTPTSTALSPSNGSPHSLIRSHPLQIRWCSANPGLTWRRVSKRPSTAIKEHFKNYSDPCTFGKAFRSSQATNSSTPPLHPVTSPYLMSSTTSMATLTGTTRRWQSRLSKSWLCPWTRPRGLCFMLQNHLHRAGTETLQCSEP